MQPLYAHPQWSLPAYSFLAGCRWQLFANALYGDFHIKRAWFWVPSLFSGNLQFKGIDRAEGAIYLLIYQETAQTGHYFAHIFTETGQTAHYFLIYSQKHLKQLIIMLIYSQKQLKHLIISLIYSQKQLKHLIITLIYSKKQLKQLIISLIYSQKQLKQLIIYAQYVCIVYRAYTHIYICTDHRRAYIHTYTRYLTSSSSLLLLLLYIYMYIHISVYIYIYTRRHRACIHIYIYARRHRRLRLMAKATVYDSRTYARRGYCAAVTALNTIGGFHDRHLTFSIWEGRMPLGHACLFSFCPTRTVRCAHSGPSRPPGRAILHIAPQIALCHENR
jgi:hypothetical protein